MRPTQPTSASYVFFVFAARDNLERNTVLEVLHGLQSASHVLYSRLSVLSIKSDGLLGGRKHEARDV
jgi:hypothetical protein